MVYALIQHINLSTSQMAVCKQNYFHLSIFSNVMALNNTPLNIEQKEQIFASLLIHFHSICVNGDFENLVMSHSLEL